MTPDEPISPGAAESLTLPLACDALTSFTQRLNRTQAADKQVTLLLDMLRSTVPADQVFVYSASMGQVTDRSRMDLTFPPWCSLLAQSLLQHAPAGVDHFSVEDVTFPFCGNVKAVLARLSQSRGAWIVAVRQANRPRFEPGELKMILLGRTLLREHQRQEQQLARTQQGLIGLVRELMAALDAREVGTAGHSERVAGLSTKLGERVGLSDVECDHLFLAGLLHDVGTVGVADRILLANGPLTEADVSAIQSHVLLGERIVARVPVLAHLGPIIRHHHERWDGQGYPDQLAGERIPLPSRILSIADACDALLSDRPYRSAVSPAQFAAILRQGSGKQWDPALVSLFCSPESPVPRHSPALTDLGLEVVRSFTASRSPRSEDEITTR